jgi:hypothetical protein
MIATDASEENECLQEQNAIEDVVDGESAESPLVLRNEVFLWQSDPTTRIRHPGHENCGSI